MWKYYFKSFIAIKNIKMIFPYLYFSSVPIRTLQIMHAICTVFILDNNAIQRDRIQVTCLSLINDT